MLAYADATSDSQLVQELREWAEYEQGVKPPVTNADRIRAMSDEEQLAKLFYSVYKRSCIDFVNQSGIKAEIKFKNSEASEAAFLKYLQSPAEEDT